MVLISRAQLREIAAWLYGLLKLVAKWLSAGVILTLLFLLIRWTGWLSSPLVSNRIINGNIQAAGDNKASQGVVYHLPRTVIGVTTVVSILDCSVLTTPAPTEKEPAATRQRLLIDISLEREIAVTNEADPDHAWVIDAATLAGPFWSSSVDLSLSNGMISFVNAASASFSVEGPFKSAAGGPQSSRISGNVSSGSSLPDAYSACGDSIAVNLERQKELRRQLKAGPSDLVAKSISAELKSVDASLSREFSATMIPKSDKPESLVLDVDPSILFETAGAQLKDALMKNRSTIVVSPRAGAAAIPLKNNNAEGIVYRDPGAASLSVCRESCKASPAGALPTTAQLWEPPRLIRVAQFGHEASIPVNRVLFSNASVRMQFAPDGSLSRLQTDDKPEAPQGWISTKEPHAPN
ncbi:hypothetical protein [Bradyrhizobium yuanmingense]|uniref:hypothetical protein n=1 Tax=Bradyrhizobium yuanmingense TaxID=108015 RepID=UPI0004B1402A|nr:hypothetical protein [Bradyrhizobium yuanmingense]